MTKQKIPQFRSFTSVYRRLCDRGWDIDFTVSHVRVYTSELTLGHANDQTTDTSSINPEWYLTIEIDTDYVTEIDGSLEAARYSRPTLIVIQGILSFITGKALAIYDFNLGSHSANLTPLQDLGIQVNRCMLHGVDYKQNVEILLQFPYSETHKAKVVASALDRWRHAMYLLDDFFDEEASPSTDEGFLAFFHVVELLAEDDFTGADTGIKGQIQNCLTDIYTNQFKLIGKSRDLAVKKTSDAMEQLVLSDVSVSIKIARFVSKHDDYDLRLREFVTCLLAIRNAIAHGRYAYVNKVTWPLPAFFTLHNNTEEMLEPLRVFSAHLIDALCGSHCWDAEWNETKRALAPTTQEVQAFIGSGEIDRCSISSLLEGGPAGITVNDIVFLYLDEKLTFRFLEKGLKRVLLKMRLTEATAESAFWSAILLAESTDTALAERCKRIVKIVLRKSWHELGSKEYLRFIEYKGKAVPWYGSWLACKR